MAFYSIKQGLFLHWNAAVLCVLLLFQEWLVEKTSNAEK